MKSSHILAAALLGVLTIPAHAALVWDAGEDLFANEKPDGAQQFMNPNFTVPEWSYGFRLTLESTGLTLFDGGETHVDDVGAPGVDGFADGGAILVNTTNGPASVTLGPVPMAPLPSHDILAIPNSLGAFTILRWTAPETGTYIIDAFWQDIDLAGGNGASGHIVVNGVALFGQTFANGAGTSTQQTIPLNAGDKVDFATGTNGNGAFDGTQFNATIVPEPATVALAGSALLVAGSLRRRRGWRVAKTD
jgi:hypothetical protein